MLLGARYGRLGCIIGDCAATKALRLQGDCAPAGKWVKERGRHAVVGNRNQLTGNAEDFAALLVLWVGGFPLDKASVIKEQARWWFFARRTFFKSQILRRPFGDERK